MAAHWSSAPLAGRCDPAVGADARLARDATARRYCRASFLPFWSPDSRFVAFDDGAGKLKKIDITGGPAQTICDVPPVTFVGGSWNENGVIIFAMNYMGVMRVSAAGGVASPLTRVDPSRREVTEPSPHSSRTVATSCTGVFSTCPTGMASTWARSM